MGLFDSFKQSAGELAGDEAHEALSGALETSSLGDVSGLLDRLHEGGLGEAVEAWATGGDHPPVSPDVLREALGDEHVQQLASSFGVDPDQLLGGLSQHLPAIAAHDAQAQDDSAHDGEDAREDEDTDA